MPMIEQPKLTAADFRRAAALIAHFGRSNAEGIVAILHEVREPRDATALLFAVLSFYDEVVPLLHTEAGTAILSNHVVRLAGIEAEE